ncbi:MAG: STAS/SEC14 domain-containing protein [Gammaproteobacteria bacterium]|nr:STAS/SEC14 domain-containing protein [Gammaproteobacteria bacterium]
MTATIRALAPHALEIDAAGVLDSDDYERVLPLAEAAISAHWYVNLLVRTTDLRGLTHAALCRDLRFDVRHFRDVARLAIVGDGPGDALLATLSRPFTAAEIRYFTDADIGAARAWVGAAA